MKQIRGGVFWFVQDLRSYTQNKFECLLQGSPVRIFECLFF